MIVEFAKQLMAKFPEIGSTEYSLIRTRIEASEDWVGIGFAMPALNFRPEWDVKILPPTTGATARFRV